MYCSKKLKLIMNMEEYPTLPTSKKDRKIGAKYLHNGNIRLWTGTKLYCEHNNQISRCDKCKEKKILDKNPEEYGENVLKLPDLNEDRIINQKYLFENEVRIWSGKRLNCIHNKNRNRCKQCNGIEEQEKEESDDESEEIEEMPKEIEKRIKGKRYMYNKEVRVWSGKRMNCVHNKMKNSCNICNIPKIKEILILPKEIEEREKNQQYFYKGIICSWDGNQLIKTNHKLKNIQIAPELNDRIENQIYLHEGSLKVWTGKVWHCKHKKRLTRCQECGGGSYCKHGSIRTRCKECDGSEICEHKKRKSQCIECKGGEYSGEICQHNSRKHRCTKCQIGGSLCEHKNRRNVCIECNGSQICEHKIQRQECRLCFGSKICKNCKYTIFNKYKPYCAPCYYHLHPNIIKPTRHRDKEWYIHDFLKENMKDIQFRHNLQIDGGCSKRRPDWFYDCLTHSVVIEADENKHIAYTCENKRVMELFQDLGNRPLIVIRFNPDKYNDNDGCFYYDNPTSMIMKVNQEEWSKRSIELLKTIQYHIENIPDKEFTEIRLFY